MKKLAGLMMQFHIVQRGEAGKPNNPKDKKKLRYLIMAAAVVMIIVGVATKH